MICRRTNSQSHSPRNWIFKNPFKLLGVHVAKYWRHHGKGGIVTTLPQTTVLLHHGDSVSTGVLLHYECTDTLDSRISALLPHHSKNPSSLTLWHWCRSVLDISAPLILCTQKCHINIYFLRKFILLMTYVTFWYFLYTTSIQYFCTSKPGYNRVSRAIVLSWWCESKQFHRSDDSFVFFFFFAESPIINA